MDISVYFNDDGMSLSSVEVMDANGEEVSEMLKTLKDIFNANDNKDYENIRDIVERCNRCSNDAEYFKLKYEKALEQITELEESAEEPQACYGEIEKCNEEIDELKLKYKIECQQNDVIKKSYDRLAKSFEELVKERDEWKSKCERRKGNVEAFEELLKERDEYKEIASDRDELKIKLDAANERIVELECEYFNYRHETVNKEHKKCNELKSES